jgi:hypothetical protein
MSCFAQYWVGQRKTNDGDAVFATIGGPAPIRPGTAAYRVHLPFQGVEFDLGGGLDPAINGRSRSHFDFDRRD